MPDHVSVVQGFPSSHCEQTHGPHVRSERHTWFAAAQFMMRQVRVLPVVQIPCDRVSTNVRTGVST